jgi:hypothetical protein
LVLEVMAQEQQVSFAVKLENFRTKKQALEFLSWYEGGGEQQFYDHLDIVGMDPDDGCNIDVGYRGNTGRYYDIVGEEIIAQVKQHG